MMVLRIAICVLLTVSTATAMSCVTPSLEYIYKEAEASEHTYYIADGYFKFDMSEQQGVSATLMKDGTRLAARFVGKRLGATGFTVKFDEAVTVAIHCAFWHHKLRLAWIWVER